MNKPVFSDNNYKVVVGMSTHKPPSIECYQVINIETNVIEAETSILPQAIQYTKDFSEHLKATLDIVSQEHVITLN